MGLPAAGRAHAHGEISDRTDVFGVEFVPFSNISKYFTLQYLQIEMIINIDPKTTAIRRVG